MDVLVIMCNNSLSSIILDNYGLYYESTYHTLFDNFEIMLVKRFISKHKQFKH